MIKLCMFVCGHAWLQMQMGVSDILSFPLLYHFLFKFLDYHFLLGLVESNELHLFILEH